VTHAVNAYDASELWRAVPYTERLFLGMTLWCPAECRHCATGSTPHSNLWMSLEMAKKIACRGRARGFVRLVLSGGEVLGRFDEIISLTSATAGIGYKVWIETNAFWASSPEVAMRCARALHEAGIEQLVISTDVYHLAFIPFERVAFAIAACEAQGIAYHVDVSHSDEINTDLRLLEAVRQNGVEPGYWDLQPMGRGAQLPARAFCQYDRSTMPECDGLCLAFDPTGRASCCCNFNQHSNRSPLSLGTLHDRDFDDIVSDFLGSPYLRLIASGGLRNAPVTDPSRVAGVCEVCLGVFNLRTFASWVEGAVTPNLTP